MFSTQKFIVKTDAHKHTKTHANIYSTVFFD